MLKVLYERIEFSWAAHGVWVISYLPWIKTAHQVLSHLFLNYCLPFGFGVVGLIFRFISNLELKNIFSWGNNLSPATPFHISNCPHTQNLTGVLKDCQVVTLIMDYIVSKEFLKNFPLLIINICKNSGHKGRGGNNS